MKPTAFEYFAPNSTSEALQLLAEYPESRPLAGGQSLIPMMNFRVARPPLIVDLNCIDSLSGISFDYESVSIGAMTRQTDLENHETVSRRWPIFRRALHHVGHTQTTTRGTIGGSLSLNDPSAELPAVMLALDANMFIAGMNGQREIKAQEFFLSTYNTAINEGEILTTINVPGLPPGATCGFSEIARRHGDFALAMCVAVLSRINGGYARLVINGMGNGPQRIENAEKVLLDGKFSETSIKAASKIVIEELDPLNDIHAPGWYRKKMARVMMIRACNMAVALMEQK